MDLRFPAPSSDDLIPTGPGAGATPSPAPDRAQARVQGRGDGKAAAPPSPPAPPRPAFDAEGRTMITAVPAYRPATPPPPPASTAPSPSPTPELPSAASPAAAPPDGAAAGPASTEPPAPAPEPPAPTPAPSEAAPKGPRLHPRRRRRVPLRLLVPAWIVSLTVHVVVLAALAAATFSAQDSARKPVNIDSALAGYRNGEREDMPILADPTNGPRDQAVGDEHADAGSPPEVIEMAEGGSEGDDGGGGTVVAAAFGGGVPTATPRVRGAGKKSVKEGSGAGDMDVEGLRRSPISMVPVVPNADLGGGGGIGGDPTFDVQGIGPALDQIAREILRHLKEHKVTVVWLFDESISMQDDQKTILEKFDRVSSELKKNLEPGKKSAGALNHAIVGFGLETEVILRKPTLDIDEIGRAIKRLRTDMTGVENTMKAIRETVEAFSGLIGKDRKMLLILVTDESGDDGADVEEARQALRKYKVPLYVIGRQSLFGYPHAHHRFVDKVTNDVYYPIIHRGPETADVEIFQWDGLYDRWDEQPSGFAPWELARLTSESNGIYFLLPSEEFMRVRRREQAYSSVRLKEYMPEYDNRLTYVQNRTASELRRTLYQVVTQTKAFTYERNFSIDPAELVRLAAQEGDKATVKLNALLEVQKLLERMKPLRDREPEKRWQAHYDLVLGQTVAFQVKAYEYRALMAGMIRKPPTPSKKPTPDLAITFVVDHSHEPVASKDETAKKYLEAKRLLEDVIKGHPNTPWADLAQDTIDRGFSVKLNEWHHNPKFTEREQFVPKY
ncbi:von Willebrand factor type A domain protein [Aquisphaera giovannonii]|uniref:von Willebrand factor type A domain protein n=1 Tax=Aquisphaera giovannonii TaxID=406548 RepID=A0A5B9WED9_9BACT|nr:vWA domain-containing protein [Aquisphaera giovannonii]QEH39026.1 von Willebrand factor type A domain protein [Aquisphaera giovannonii]